MYDEHTVVRGFRDRNVKVATRSCEGRRVLGLFVRIGEQLLEPCVFGGGCMFRSQFDRHAFCRALRVQDLGGADTGEIQLNGEGFGEQAWVAGRNPRSTAFAHLDLGDSQRFQRPQGIASDDPAHPEAGRNVLLRAEEIARPDPAAEQGVTDLRHHVRRERCGAAGAEDPLRNLAADHQLPHCRRFAHGILPGNARC